MEVRKVPRTGRSESPLELLRAGHELLVFELLRSLLGRMPADRHAAHVVSFADAVQHGTQVRRTDAHGSSGNAETRDRDAAGCVVLLSAATRE